MKYAQKLYCLPFTNILLSFSRIHEHSARVREHFAHLNGHHNGHYALVPLETNTYSAASSGRAASFMCIPPQLASRECSAESSRCGRPRLVDDDVDLVAATSFTRVRLIDA